MKAAPVWVAQLASTAASIVVITEIIRRKWLASAVTLSASALPVPLARSLELERLGLKQ